MAANAHIDVARRFHDDTAHTPVSVRTSGRTLDWDVKPFPFKVYADLPALPLPRDLPALTAPALDAVLRAPGGAPRPLDLATLAALLYYAAGVTRKKRYPGGAEVLFRAAPSTGALYQTEVYVAAGAVTGLAPGLYHFCPGDFALRRLRDADVRGALAEAAADDGIGARAATIVLSAIAWRNTWKYGARGYRHFFWDSGTMLANLLAVARALSLGPRVLTGFADAAVNAVLGVDGTREAALELVPLGPPGPRAPRAPLGAIDHATLPLSAREVDEPALRAVHAASALDTADEVRAWRAAAAVPPRPRPAGALVALPAARSGGRPLGDTIQRRGSTREFSHAALALDELATALAAAAATIDGDVPFALTDLYLVVNAVDGLAPGAYRYWPEPHALETLAAGAFRRQSAFLCLEQALGGDAAAVLYFLAPLDAILAAFGNRGYRLANLEAGLRGGRAYLAAYALGFGATGLTFYDTEVVRFFSPHASGEDAIFVTALGRAARGTRGDR